jgi:hypothetical protein
MHRSGRPCTVDGADQARIGTRMRGPCTLPIDRCRIPVPVMPMSVARRIDAGLHAPVCGKRPRTRIERCRVSFSRLPHGVSHRPREHAFGARCGMLVLGRRPETTCGMLAFHSRAPSQGPSQAPAPSVDAVHRLELVTASSRMKSAAPRIPSAVVPSTVAGPEGGSGRSHGSSRSKDLDGEHQMLETWEDRHISLAVQTTYECPPHQLILGSFNPQHSDAQNQFSQTWVVCLAGSVISAEVGPLVGPRDCGIGPHQPWGPYRRRAFPNTVRVP